MGRPDTYEGNMALERGGGAQGAGGTKGGSVVQTATSRIPRLLILPNNKLGFYREQKDDRCQNSTRGRSGLKPPRETLPSANGAFQLGKAEAPRGN